MGTDWLMLALIIVLAFGIKNCRDDIDELKRQINKLKGGEV